MYVKLSYKMNMNKIMLKTYAKHKGGHIKSDTINSVLFHTHFMTGHAK